MLKMFNQENDHDLTFQSDDEFFIAENMIFEIFLSMMSEHLFVHVDRNFDEKAESDSLTDNYIRRVLNTTKCIIRSVRQFHQTRGELKMKYFEREKLSKIFDKSHVSFSYLLFIDDLKIHWNNYRFFKAFYFTSVDLSYKKRRKLINVFILTLRSHEVNIENVIECIFKIIRRLDKNDVEMNIVEETVFVCAFEMTLLDDMSQQTHNKDFLYHFARMSYRTCYCLRKERENLEYDVVVNDRYHREIINQREYAKNLTDRDKIVYLQKMKIKQNSSTVERLMFSLNLIMIRIYDASHSEWRDLDRIL